MSYRTLCLLWCPILVSCICKCDSEKPLQEEEAGSWDGQKGLGTSTEAHMPGRKSLRQEGDKPSILGCSPEVLGFSLLSGLYLLGVSRSGLVWVWFHLSASPDPLSRVT